jgi:iron complex transport system substrate-binding protein
MMAGSVMSACGQSGQSTAAATAVETTAAAQPETESESEEIAESETGSETAAETGAETNAETRTVKDSNGNEVEIPAEVTRVAPAIGAFAQVTEMLGQGKMAAAATAQISDYFKEVFPDYNESNPDNYDSTSVEDLIASGTQVVYGPASLFTQEQQEQLKQAGIAYVCINNLSDSKSMMESFQLIGEIMGSDEAKRAKEFCEYYQSSIDDCQARTADLSQDERKQVLSLNVNGGSYTTVNKTDIFSSIVDEAGGVNVAYDYQVADAGAGQGQGGKGQGGQGQDAQNQGGKGQGQGGQGGKGQGGKPAGGPQSGLSLDAEQIIAWNPDIIITSSKAGKETIMSDPALATVKAVEEDQVYVRPQGIYMWGVRSGENAMMTPWLGTKLYPERFEDVDMEQIVIDFFDTWYHTDIDAAKAEEILAGK